MTIYRCCISYDYVIYAIYHMTVIYSISCDDYCICYISYDDYVMYDIYYMTMLYMLYII